MPRQIFKIIEACLQFDDMNFGDGGILPYLHVVHHNLDKVKILDYGIAGGINQDGKQFYLWREDGQLPKGCKTIAMYATSQAKTFSKLDENVVRDKDILFSRLVRDLLTKNEWQTTVNLRPRRKYRFHYPGLVHLPISERYMGCAFTQKIVKLSKMLLSLGHEVILYGAQGSDAPCTEFVQTHTLDDIREAWGEGDNRFRIGYDWKSKGFKHDFNTTRTEATKKYYEACSREIEKRKKDDDFLLLAMGAYQKPIHDSTKLFLTCEPGIGYRGSYTKFRAFESAYLQNFTYGSEHPKQSINGNYYDRVIPNYFEAEHFPFNPKKEDYFFFIGRMIERKGVYTAVKVAEALKTKLILAGQGELPINSDYCEFVGYIDPEERAKLMGGAKAVFVPTIYLEAFGGVNVEAQLCGTPAITTNFGVFPETVKHGITGYCCDTLDDFVQAGRDVGKLNPYVIRKHAERYLTDNVKCEYQKWFDDLYQLYLSAKNPGTKGWHYLTR